MAKGAEAVLIITGSMGSGKTTVMAEASDILALEGIHHASIDLDALGTAHLPAPADPKVSRRNLRCVWDNYAASGASRLLLAAAIESRDDLEDCRNAVAATAIVICRLTASIKTMQERVRLREPGILQEQFVKRVVDLNAVLDLVRLEDFCIVNENRSITKVAREMLVRAGWLAAKGT